MSTLEDVLSETRLTGYENHLKENGCELLSDLLDHESKNELIDTLKDCGITNFMHRKRLVNKIWAIKTSGSNANNNNNNNNNNNGNNNNNNRNNRNNGNRNNNYNDNDNNNDNNNNSDELSQVRRQMEAMKLRFEMEKMQREEEESKRATDLIHKLNNNNNNNNNKFNTFPVTYDIGDDKVWFTHIFRRSDTVKRLYKAYAKYSYSDDDDSLLEKFELIYSGTILRQNVWNKTLESVGMGTNPRLGDYVFVVASVKGS